jgi:hypothetical protein
LLLKEALVRYHDTHKQMPARLVIHKTSPHNDDEIAGFRDAAESERVSVLDFVSVSNAGTARLYRFGKYAPLRGTLLSLDACTHTLYTTGSVDFYRTYPGLYVPHPLVFRCDRTDATPKDLAAEILALTKMNWNKTQFDGWAPITVLAARSVGAILKYIPDGGHMEPHYSHYM